MAKHPVAKMDAALPRVTAREILSISHEVSRLSPVTADTCLPNLRKKATVEGPSTPVVSTETGSNKYRSVRARYRSPCVGAVSFPLACLGGSGSRARGHGSVDNRGGAECIDACGIPCETFSVAVRKYCYAIRPTAISPIQAHRLKP